MAEHNEQHAKRREYMRNYLREYRKRNPDKSRQWRDNYTLRRAERLRAEAEANQNGGGDRGGN